MSGAGGGEEGVTIGEAGLSKAILDLIFPPPPRSSKERPEVSAEPQRGGKRQWEGSSGSWQLFRSLWRFSCRQTPTSYFCC